MATSSHICPGPNFGYINCSIKLVSTFFWERDESLENLDLNALDKVFLIDATSKIRQVFGINSGLRNFLKVKMKCLIIRLLSIFGLVQNLAKKRNMKFSSIDEKKEFQAVVDTIVNKFST